MVCLLFSKILSGTLSVLVLNGLDLDQDQCSIGPDLDPNCANSLCLVSYCF